MGGSIYSGCAHHQLVRPRRARPALPRVHAHSCRAHLPRLSPWLERTHPDPRGEQLRKIAFVLEAFATQAREYGTGCRCGVFWDCMRRQDRTVARDTALSAREASVWMADASLPQKRRDGVDDRSGEEKQRFKDALKGINAWYGHPKTHVLLVSTPLPTGAPYSNVQPYAGRGW